MGRRNWKFSDLGKDDHYQHNPKPEDDRAEGESDFTEDKCGQINVLKESF